MEWATPTFHRREIDGAGDLLASGRFDDAPETDAYHALEVISNWRSSHNFPLNTFQVTLRRKARDIDPQAIVVQRIKRLRSIEEKLRRFSWISLSGMQDIAGCRAVLRTSFFVRRLVDTYKRSDVRHDLADEDDYIREPKRSGYRGYHLIYKYQSDKKDTFNGLKIEMQFRSRQQHAWATAVETVGTFIRQALKSSAGEKEWLRFFSLMGSAFARREQTELIPGTPTTKRQLLSEIRELAHSLDVRARLHSYGAALQALEQPPIRKAHFFLLRLEPPDRLYVAGFRQSESLQAHASYLKAEQETKVSGGDAVLVGADSVAALRRAYPNYYLDTNVFLGVLEEVLAGKI